MTGWRLGLCSCTVLLVWLVFEEAAGVRYAMVLVAALRESKRTMCCPLTKCLCYKPEKLPGCPAVVLSTNVFCLLKAPQQDSLATSQASNSSTVAEITVPALLSNTTTSVLTRAVAY